MDLDQLRAFCAVARRRSFTRASEELHLSQPAVSRQVEALEASLGMSLFSRQGRRVALTEPGRRLLDYAERILGLVAQAERALAELRSLATGSLTIAASTTPGNYLLPAVLAAFQERHPGVEARLAVHPSADVERLTLAGQADLGVAATPLRSPGLHAFPYREDELLLIAPAGHPLAACREVGPAELAAALERDCLLLREPASATRRATEEHLRALGIRPRRLVEIGQTEAIKRAVAAGMGLSFASRQAVADALAAGGLAAPPGPAARIRRQIHFLLPKGARLSPAALAFVALARKDAPPRSSGSDAPAQPGAQRARGRPTAPGEARDGSGTPPACSLPREGGEPTWRTSASRSA